MAGVHELKQFEHLFTLRTQKDLVNGHLWLSVVTKQAHVKFSRTERLTCVLTVLFTTMLANILLFTYSNTSEDQLTNAVPIITLGSLRITSFALIEGVIGALITIPVNMFIVVVFSQRHHRTSEQGVIKNTTEKYRLPSKTPLWKQQIRNLGNTEEEPNAFRLVRL